MMSWPGWAAERRGLPEDEAARRLRVVGPNAVRSHRVHALSVLASQLRSPLLILLAVTAHGVVVPRPGQRRGDHRRDPGRLGRPGVRQRVQGGEDRRGAAFERPAQLRGAAGRAPAHGGRDRAGARRRGGPAAGPGGPRRPAAAGRGGPGVRRVGADRRVAAGGEVHRAGRRRDAAGRAELLRADGHRGAGRVGHRRGGRDRRRRGVRPDRRWAWESSSPRPSSRSGCASSRCCWSTWPGC